MSRLLTRFGNTRAVFFSVVTLAFFLSSVGTAYAGFGITPPYVNNQRLTRGSTFQQTITLVRSDPTEDLRADISMNIPGIEDWFSVDQGNSFTLPKGQMQVPIVITVKVPQNAEYKAYKGSIRIRTSSANTSPDQANGVSIALGAQVDVNLQVVDKIYDFNVRRIRLSSLEEGRTKWGLFFPGKIRFYMTIENTGNTDYGPTRVHFDIYDYQMETLLESVDNTNSIDKLPPFAIREVVAELPTRLSAGHYIAKYTIYKGKDIAQQNQVDVSIAPVGSIPGYEGYGFDGLSIADKLKVLAMVGVPFVLILILIGILVSKRGARKRQRRI